MGYVKTIVCLANSRKYSGRCVVGKEVSPGGFGGWIRPVSPRPTAELSEEERRFESGQDPRLLDIVAVPLIAPVPSLHQTENHMIDPARHWSKTGELPWAERNRLLDHPSSLWPGDDSSCHGRNDRVKLGVTATLTGSLLLIEPEDLVLRVQTEGAEFDSPRRRVRARFHYRHVHYVLAVTDPVAERAFLSKADGDYPVEDALLCVSLGEPHSDDHCYKLVAAVLSGDLLGGRE